MLYIAKIIIVLLHTKKTNIICFFQHYLLTLQHNYTICNHFYRKIYFAIESTPNPIVLQMLEANNLLSDYFANKAEEAIDSLWDEDKITAETIEEWKYEHMRVLIE